MPAKPGSSKVEQLAAAFTSEAHQQSGQLLMQEQRLSLLRQAVGAFLSETRSRFLPYYPDVASPVVECVQRLVYAVNLAVQQSQSVSAPRPAPAAAPVLPLCVNELASWPASATAESAAGVWQSPACCGAQAGRGVVEHACAS